MKRLHEKSPRKIIFSLIITALVITSTIINIGMIGINDNIQNENESLISPISSAPVDDSWAGYGSNQSVYSYINNISSSINQEDSFNISVPTSPSKIYSADINLTLESNYNTTYYLEQDSPLKDLSPEKTSDTRDSAIFADNFVMDVGYPFSGIPGYVYDAGVDTAYKLGSLLDEINCTYTADFTDVADFDRSNVMGLKYSFDKEVTTAPNGENVSIQIYTYNDVTAGWDQLDDSVGVWTKNREIVSYSTINTRFQNINNLNQTIFKLRLNSTGILNVSLFDIRVEALYAIEKNITNTDWVALEFDLKGNSTVYGFNAWIRTLNRTAIPEANLTISLYRATNTDTRDVNGVLSPTAINLEPDFGELISSINFTGYTGDNEYYFNFAEDFTGFDLNVSNYFIVISSNVTNAQYSIVTLASDHDTDGIEHLFLHSTNSGVTWEKEFRYLDSYQVDAALFSINLTRGWMPSEINLKIDEQSVSNYEISTGIYEQTSGYTWGLGKWNHVFNNKVEDILGNITIDLNWTIDYTSNLVFNSTYDVSVISMEQGISYYNISLEKKPTWIVNYTLDLSKYTSQWSIEKFGYYIPSDWESNNILDPSRKSVWTNMSESSGNKPHTSSIWLRYDKTIQYSGNGNYTLNCTGLNYVYNMTAKLNYNESYYDTNAIMQGDNITVSLNVFNYTSFTSEINSGIAGVTLFDIDGEVLAYLNPDDFVDDTKEFEIYETELLLSTYNFNNTNILNTTNANEKGEYSLVFNWTNGNEIGFRKQSLFITDYSVSIYDVYADMDEKVNVLQAIIDRNETDQQFMDFAVFSINETTDTGYNPPENMVDMDLGIHFSLDGVNVTKFTLNETLLNPGEKIKLNITIKSTNDWISNDVKVGIQFVQMVNTKWIVMEKNSSLVVLNKTGGINSERILEFEFDVPADNKGVNGPIRINPFIVLFQLWINTVEQQQYVVNNLYLPFTNHTDSEFEGIVLGHKMVNNKPIGPTFIAEMDRSEAIIPGNTTYIVQTYDNYFVGTEEINKETFDFDLISEIVNVETIDTAIWGTDFELIGYLQDEFGNEISGADITIQYKRDGIWYDYNENSGDNILATDSNGVFSGLFDSTVINKKGSIDIKLAWIGDDDHMLLTEEFSINLIQYKNSFKASIVNYTDQPHFERSKSNTIYINFLNNGNSTLNQINFSLSVLVDGIEISEGNLNLLYYKSLAPGKSLVLEYYIHIPNSYSNDNLTIIIVANGTSIESNEEYSTSISFTLDVIDAPTLTNLEQLLIIMFIFTTIAVWLVSIIYVKNTHTKLQEVPEIEEKKSKKGKYVNVSELSKNIDKIDSAKEKPKKKERSTDLDELLKEEGLDKDSE